VVNSFYLAAPTSWQNAMDKFAKLVGRQYHLFDYVGAPDADRVIVLMGSGADVAHETMDAMIAAARKSGSSSPFVRPSRRKPSRPLRQLKSIAVLDRTKEPGALGERCTAT